MSHHETEDVVHEYDGIQELDNFLPRWWVLLFYLSIGFGILYLAFYHVTGKGLLPRDKFAASVQAYKAEQAALAAAMPVDTNAVAAIRPLTDAPTLAQGRKIFTTYCVACHTDSGAGLVGPNLTDAYWLHGATFAENVFVITHGVPEKGMISWAPILKPDEIKAVGSYIYTLRGSRPANPKDPEGQEIPGSDSADYDAGAVEAAAPATENAG